MKVYDLQNKEEQVFAFEVKVTEFWWGRSSVVAVLLQIPEVRIIRAPYYFEFFDDDVFCEFEVNGKRFEVWEPYGDSDRFWIGPIHPSHARSLNLCERFFLITQGFKVYGKEWHKFLDDDHLHKSSDCLKNKS